MQNVFLLVCALVLNKEQNEKIENKIYQNECSSLKKHLIHWNKGEIFGSFGIGHFIWYPEGVIEKYEETLPALIAFLKEEGEKIPLCLQKKKCPWCSYEQFALATEKKTAQEIEDFLYKTKEGQVRFMQKRLEKALIEIKSTLNEREKNQLSIALEKLQQDPRGGFILIDYSNFKGTGLCLSEEYQGNRWGLMQVLLAMDLEKKDPVQAFVKAAKDLLLKRVESAPKEKEEKRWLSGWYRRLDRYLESL